MKRILLLLFTTLIVFSCKEDDIDVAPLPPTPIDVMVDNGDAVTSAIEGVVIDEENKPIAEATVTVGNITVSTNIHGRFYVTDVMTYERALMTFSKEGYFSNYKTVHPKDGGISHVTVKLQKEKLIGSISSESGGTVGNEMVTLDFPANAIKDYSGTVNVYVNYIDPSAADFTTTAPTLEAVNQSGNLGALISYGMANIELQDANGNELELVGNVAVSLSLAVPNELLTTAPAQIPLWSFNETEGVWVEEGEAILENGAYTGNVWHFSLWNCDTWEDTVCEVEFQLVDQNNENINTSSIIRFTVETEDGESFVAEETTNSDGSFEACLPTNATSYVIEVLPNTFGEEGVGFCEIATVTLNNVSYDETNEISVTIDPESQVVVNGTVDDCNGEPLAYGLIMIESSNGEMLSVIVTDGVFSAETAICEEGETYDVSVYDANTHITSEPFTLNEFDLGEITATVCEGVIENIIWIGDLSYGSQGDEFLAGGYNVVHGNVNARGRTNLNKLINLRRVTGTITLGDPWDWPMLEDVSGLSNLRSVKKLYFDSTYELETIALNELREVSNMIFYNGEAVKTIETPQLNAVDSLEISATRIKDLNGLSSINSISSYAKIRYNSLLYDYCGMQDALIDIDEYIVVANKFNATQEMLMAGECTGAEEVLLEGDINTMTLTNDKIWLLKGLCHVNEGETLTIEPGTIIKGFYGAFLIIQPGAKIIADGTVNQPIIFTRNSDGIQPGETDSGEMNLLSQSVWGGIIVAGNAPVSSSTNSNDELGTITLQIYNYQTQEDEFHDITFGGNNSLEDSGILNYVSIRGFGGGRWQYESPNWVNGLTLAGIGSETVINQVEVTKGRGDGVRIHGGSVNVNNLLASEYWASGLTVTSGYQGIIDNILLSQNAAYSNSDYMNLKVTGHEVNGVLEDAEMSIKNTTLYNSHNNNKLIKTSRNALVTFEELAVKDARLNNKIWIAGGTDHVTYRNCEFNKSENEMYIFHSWNSTFENNLYDVTDFTVGADEPAFDWTYAKQLGVF